MAMKTAKKMKEGKFDLEKLERKTGLTTADYSGIVTVSIAANN